MKSYRPAAVVTLTVLMIVWGSTFLVTSVLFLGIVASGLAYVVYNWTLRHLEASVVGVISNLDPIVGVLSAVIFLGATMVQVAGGIAAHGGMTMATLQGNKGEQREAKAVG